MKLYEISQEMLTAIQKYNDVEDDLALEELGKTLTDLQATFNDKAVAVAHHILNTRADVTAVEAEIARLRGLKERAEKQEEWFMGYLKNQMEATNTPEINGQTVKLRVVKNPQSVIIEDESKIPATYTRVKTVREIDKKKILETWKDGMGVAGTKVEQKTRLKIS